MVLYFIFSLCCLAALVVQSVPVERWRMGLLDKSLLLSSVCLVYSATCV